MKPTKAYILMIDSDVSREYAKTAAESCEKVGIPWEYFQGYTEKDDPWRKLPIQSRGKLKVNGKGGAATAGHIHIWHKIASGNECAVVLEHDSILLHNPNIDIPDDTMVVLGYKVRDPQNYNHELAGPPRIIESRQKHGGAHAYALTPRGAKTLIEDIEQSGLSTLIDNYYFLRMGKRRHNKLKLAITDPICALGWLRKSTIWNKSAVDNYKPILQSFQKNYNSTEDLGLKSP
jgi:GR25 family glycosyltransferase involved in LPS biosynthesis